MLQPTKMRYDKAGPKVVEALKKRHFDAYYCTTREEGIAKVMELIPAEDSVSWGGTMTVDELGIKDLLRQRGQQVIDRDTAADMDERMAIMRQGLTCDTFLTSSNAITEDGQLFNIDGNGNRVAAMIFGPKSVVVVAGMNKVVADMDAAYAHVRHNCAPAVVQRFPNAKTPCNVTGACADCIGEDSCCAYMVATRVCRPAGKIKVVLIGEDLGL
ncbi:MAG: lactate utilization protein [Clostridiales bacterium]|nr:lactate utilization protein [Candidatus Cacconaster stercorequi]